MNIEAKNLHWIPNFQTFYSIKSWELFLKFVSLSIWWSTRPLLEPHVISDRCFDHKLFQFLWIDWVIEDLFDCHQMSDTMSEADKSSMEQRVIMFSELRDALIGPNRIRSNRMLVPMAFGGGAIKTREERMVEKAFESCAFKTVISCVMGFGLGAAIGLFSASVGPDVTSQETQTVRQVFKDMKIKTMSYAKNFAILGAMFAAIECTIESVGLRQINHLSYAYVRTQYYSVYRK